MPFAAHEQVVMGCLKGESAWSIPASYREPEQWCEVGDFGVVAAGVSISATGRRFSKFTLTAKFDAIVAQSDGGDLIR